MQAVEEVLAEAAFFHLLLQVDVGGGDDADVDLDRLHAAEAHELALLHHPQQLGLRLDRDVANLVEEDAALVGQVEHALLRVDRPGERALDVAEEGRLEQVGRQVAGVDRDERLVGARRVAVDGPRHQLLAGAALAGDEDGRAARRRLDDQVEDLLHPRAAADDAGELVVARLQVLLEGDVLGHQPPALDGVVEDDQHLVVLERLGDVVERALLHRADRRLHRGERRHHDHRQLVVDRPHRVEDLQPVHLRHHHVGDDGVERRRARQFEPVATGRGDAHGVALAGQQRLEDLAHDLFVVDDEDRALAAHGVTRAYWPAPSWRDAGRRSSADRASAKPTTKVVPCPTALWHSIVPSCSWTMP